MSEPETEPPTEAEMMALRHMSDRLTSGNIDIEAPLALLAVAHATNSHALLFGRGILTYDGDRITFDDPRWREMCGLREGNTQPAENSPVTNSGAKIVG